VRERERVCIIGRQVGTRVYWVYFYFLGRALQGRSKSEARYPSRDGEVTSDRPAQPYALTLATYSVPKFLASAESRSISSPTRVYYGQYGVRRIGQAN
jgi:hypothetical protein